MTEFVKPPRPEPSEVVTRHAELLSEYHKGRQRMNSITLRGRDRNTPDPYLLGKLDPEEWGYSEAYPEIRFSQTERLAVFESAVLADIDELTATLEVARKLAEYSTEHEAELLAYEVLIGEWLDACRAIDRAEEEARYEARREQDRARWTVGKWVRPFRARNSWEIIARNGKGGIIREVRYDDKPARIREVADILEVA